MAGRRGALRVGAVAAAIAVGLTVTGCAETRPSSGAPGDGRPADLTLVDAQIADRCGNPSVGDAVGSSVSPVRRDEMHTRTAVLRFRSSGAAEVAAHSLGVDELAECLATAVNGDLAADGITDVAPATPGAFDTAEYADPSEPDARVVVSRFEEEVLGGNDNSHVVARFVAPRGTDVVIAIAVSSSQNETPDRAVARARHLGSAALH